MTLPNTKKCKKCGWVYPITHPESSCRFCHTVFEKRFCNSCGEYRKPYPNIRMYCRECALALRLAQYTPEEWVRRRARYDRKIKEKQDKRLEDWLQQINKLPFRPLTNEEWLITCAHFKKCAVCGKEEIAARAFFVAFKLGGRYTFWNVIPVCEKCANTARRLNHPFIRYKNTVETIVEYLQPIIDKEAADAARRV